MGLIHQLSKLTLQVGQRLSSHNTVIRWIPGKMSMFFNFTLSSISTCTISFLHRQIAQDATPHTELKTRFKKDLLVWSCTKLFKEATEIGRGLSIPHHAQIFLQTCSTTWHLKKQWSKVSSCISQKTHVEEVRRTPLLNKMDLTGMTLFTNLQ